MIEVITSGIFTTIQDLGRLGHRNIGVPISGSMDHYSAFIANSLLGNDKNAAVMEMTITGPQLKFHENASIAIVGASTVINLNGDIKKQNTVIRITKGDLLSLESMKNGMRCYLAIMGGFTTEKVLNSRSFYTGITKKGHLVKGDLLTFFMQSKYKISHKSTVKLDQNHLDDNVLNVYPGPEFYNLSKSIQSKLFNKNFKVASTSNRMAYQFETPISMTKGETIKEVITSTVQPGTVQLTPSGEVIVLMRDCQTTGGYARVLQLTQQAINQLSQKTVNTKVKFNRYL